MPTRGTAPVIAGLENPAQYPNLTQAMERRGWSEADLRARLRDLDELVDLGLRGRVVEVISEERGAGAGINRLAKKYLGVEEYPYRAPGERRVQFRVRPEVVSGWGKD